MVIRLVLQIPATLDVTVLKVHQNINGLIMVMKTMYDFMADYIHGML